MVTWSYVHTGGLPLTNVSMSYTFEDEFIISRPVPVSISSVDTTRITVPNLEAGYRYTFNVTSQNRVGATTALCGLVIPASGRVYMCQVLMIRVIINLSLPLCLPPSLPPLSPPPIFLLFLYLSLIIIDQSATENNIGAIIVGGMIGGLAALVLIIGFATFLTILCLRKKGIQ